MGRRRQPKNAFPAEHYEKRLSQLAKVGVVKAKHSDSTKNNINEISLRWKLFCETRKKHPLLELKAAERGHVMIFLEWILDNYGSRKRTNIRQKFKHWRQLFRKYANQRWSEGWRQEINDYINGELTERYNLDISTKEKPVANVDDVYLVLHHHWALDTSIFPDERQRLQLAFVILVCAYTVTRPGAVVYVPRNAKVLTECAIGPDPEYEEETQDTYADAMNLDPEEVFECLCYKHVTLVLLPNPDGERDILAMEVDLRFTKGHKRNFKRIERPK